MISVPAVVRRKARAAGAEAWLERLPSLVSSLEADWFITVGRPYEGGSAAFVAEATRADGTPAVLKVVVPGPGTDPASEATVLRLAGGDGCPVLYRFDPGRGGAAHGAAGPPHVRAGLAALPPPRDSLRHRRAHMAARTGLGLAAIWEWGVVERLSTGLLCTRIHLQPLGRDTLRAAEAVTGVTIG